MKWRCPTCEVINPSESVRCNSCFIEKPYITDNGKDKTFLDRNELSNIIKMLNSLDYSDISPDFKDLFRRIEEALASDKALIEKLSSIMEHIGSLDGELVNLNDNLNRESLNEMAKETLYTLEGDTRDVDMKNMFISASQQWKEILYSNYKMNLQYKWSQVQKFGMSDCKTIMKTTSNEEGSFDLDLVKLRDIEYLFLNNLALKEDDVINLSVFRNLKYISLSNNRLTTLNSLNGNKNLKEIVANDNLISNIDGLIGLVQLEALSLKCNRIDAIKPLTYLKNLTYLDCSDNLIEDISDISQIEKLKILNCTGNPDLEMIEKTSSIFSVNC